MAPNAFFRKRPGFTLIELLIVVAIIAILAAIAVPNFLEAQTRAKVSRVRADLRSLATALEAYRVDNNNYPPTPFVTGGDSGVLHVIPDRLSTPVSYISSANFEDPFISPKVGPLQMLRTTGAAGLAGEIATWAPDTGLGIEVGDPLGGRRYYYRSHRDPRRNAGLQADFAAFTIPFMGDWVVVSLGPDRKRNSVLGGGAGQQFDYYIPYDPTNGTVSDGDIVRTQRQPEGGMSN